MTIGTVGTVTGIEHFQQLYLLDDDPWQVRTQWYEQRKRNLILACLPRQHYNNAYEPGCGNGELTAALALRCSRLLATDGAESAVALTRKKIREENSEACVVVKQQLLPEQWPDDSYGKFDLIVISELAYYLDVEALVKLISHATASLASQGTLLLSHWRHPFDDRKNTTEEVHTMFHQLTGLKRIVHHDDTDFMLDVWSDMLPSIAHGEQSI